MIPLLTLASLFVPPAHAAGPTDAAPSAAPAAGAGEEDASRLVVHLDARARPPDATIVLKFATEGGADVEVSLADDGERVDPVADDGVWSGVAQVPGGRAKVTASAGPWSVAASGITLPTDRPRVLDLTVSGETLILAPSGTLPTRAPSPESGLGKGEAGAKAGQRSSNAPQGSGEGGHRGGKGKMKPEATDPPRSGLWLGALAAGLASLALSAWFWFRRSRRAVELPEGVSRVAEAGLLGPSTPPVTVGVSQWVVEQADAADLVGQLVRAVAENRPVLAHAAPEVSLPETRGQPAFRAWFAQPAELQDAAYDLQEAYPTLALVLVPPQGTNALTEWSRDLERDFPVLAVVTTATPAIGTVIRCSRAAGTWTFVREAGAAGS